MDNSRRITFNENIEHRLAGAALLKSFVGCAVNYHDKDYFIKSAYTDRSSNFWMYAHNDSPKDMIFSLVHFDDHAAFTAVRGDDVHLSLYASDEDNELVSVQDRIKELQLDYKLKQGDSLRNFLTKSFLPDMYKTNDQYHDLIKNEKSITEIYNEKAIQEKLIVDSFAELIRQCIVEFKKENTPIALTSVITDVTFNAIDRPAHVEGTSYFIKTVNKIEDMYIRIAGVTGYHKVNSSELTYIIGGNRYTFDMLITYNKQLVGMKNVSK